MSSADGVAAGPQPAPSARGGPGLRELAGSRGIVVIGGAGGVGKTTVAASFAAAVAATEPGRVLVLTIDPARRLATSLGVGELGNAETLVGPERWAEAGIRPRGELWAAMLDTRAAWDDLVRRHAPDAGTARAILANRLYANVTSRFAESHPYVASERLHELVEQGGYDLVVVDTPPSRQAIDVIDAPRRMREFFAGRLLRWLIAPATSRLVGLASRPFFVLADRVLGAQFLADVGAFFRLMSTMEDGFVSTADAVETMLRDEARFVVVTTPEPGPAREAATFAAALVERGHRLGAVVLNRAVPDWVTAEPTVHTGVLLATDAEGVAAQVAGAGAAVPAGPLGRVLAEVGRSHRLLLAAAERQDAVEGELAGAGAALVRLAIQPDELTDLGALVRAGRLLG
ncbi:MAG: AAA family ATPase [Acidimicrobiia bacterium]|nr:AAA family ATPase [Acidimicrobiia bacterium]